MLVVHALSKSYNFVILFVQELIYVWNGFFIIGKRQELLLPMLTIVEETVNDIIQNKGSF